MNRRVGAFAVAFVAALVFGGAAPPALAAAPPTLKVEVIGAGKVTGLGIGCGLGSLACYSTYGANPQSVALTVTAASGWTFSHWEDSGTPCDGTSTNPCTFPVTGNMTATAVLTPPSGVVQTNTFGVSLPSTPGGTVTNGAASYPIDCPATSCSLTTYQASTITVVEQPSSGDFFGGWGGSCSGTAVWCATYLNANKTASAAFLSSSTQTLTVSVSGNGSVTGGGINCGPGSTCDEQEPPNSTVTLTAQAGSGYAFVGWSGACTGSQSTCAVQMDTTRSVTATFDQLVPFSLTVSGAGTVSGGGVTCGPGPQTCTGTVAPEQAATFTASPSSGGSVFWSGCSSAAGTICTVNVGTSALSITATFSGGAPPPSTDALSIVVQGDGYVTSASNSSVHCTAAGGTGCTVNVQANTSLTLTAVPASGSTGDFTHWLGACSSFTTTTCTLTMTGPKGVEADFAGGNTTYVLTGQVVGSGSIAGAGLSCTSAGGAACSAQQAAGATVTLTATPSFGSRFSGWSNGCTGTSTTCQVSMTNAKTVTATFTGSGGGAALSLAVTGAGEVSASGGTCANTSGRTKTCTQQYTDGQKVVLTAKPAKGFALTAWSGACSGRRSSCEVTMSSGLTVGATFARPVLAPSAAPKVAKRTIRFSYVAHEAGTVTMTAKGPGKVPAKTATIRAGRRTLTLTVPKPGRYTFTLTLASASGTHAIRWRLTVK